MNKTEMAMKLAKKTGLSQGKSAEILDALFSAHPRKGIIAVALDSGEKVTIPGFGSPPFGGAPSSAPPAKEYSGRASCSAAGFAGVSIGALWRWCHLNRGGRRERRDRSTACPSFPCLLRDLRALCG
jgi:hypothetical protein